MNRDIAYRDWRGAGLARGTHQGTAVRDGALVIGETAGTRWYDDPHDDRPPVRYHVAAWVSPEVRPGFGITALVPSWNARTPTGTWLEVEARATYDDALTSRWWSLGRWAEGDAEIHPTSVPGQGDEVASVAVDVLAARGPRPMRGYQLRVSLLRRPGSTATPAVTLVGAVASDVPDSAPHTVSPPGPARGTVLDVPAYSQQVHRAEYPQWGNGGESWCSPTSTSMVLAHWDTGPDPAEYAWVDPAYPDRWVDHAARHVFDHAYGGPGNWSFNVAYAARFGTTAFVTRLRSLSEAEEFIVAGIPLVVTVTFNRDQLDGAGYDTQGHLLTIVGFDESGDVVVNDPASHGVASNDKVRTTFDRAQFEQVWLGSAGGLAYVIHPPEVPLPPRRPQANW